MMRSTISSRRVIAARSLRLRGSGHEYGTGVVIDEMTYSIATVSASATARASPARSTSNRVRPTMSSVSAIISSDRSIVAPGRRRSAAIAARPAITPA